MMQQCNGLVKGATFDYAIVGIADNDPVYNATVVPVSVTYPNPHGTLHGINRRFKFELRVYRKNGTRVNTRYFFVDRADAQEELDWILR